MKSAEHLIEDAAQVSAPAAINVPSVQPNPVPVVAAQSTTPAQLLAIAVQNGADLDRLERLMALQVQWEEREAEKAYNAAFAAFKAEAVRVIKAKTVSDGPLKGRSYAELHDVVQAVTPALSRHGLSASWKITRDERDWIEVTCTIKHIAGHSESVSMGGPPDTGGAKNPIQARASAKSYLERYTLKAVCGVAEQDDDDDGAGGGSGALDALIMRLGTFTNVDDLTKFYNQEKAAFIKAHDMASADRLKAAAVERRRAILEATKQEV